VIIIPALISSSKPLQLIIEALDQSVAWIQVSFLFFFFFSYFINLRSGVLFLPVRRKKRTPDRRVNIL